MRPTFPTLIIISGAIAGAGPLAQPVASQPAKAPAVSAGSIERLAPGLDALVAPEATIEKIADGFLFIEGPVWVEAKPESYLLFSDIPANKVFRWTQDDGVSVFLDPVLLPDASPGGSAATGATGGSNGLTLDPEGRLVLCEHGNRRVARLEDDGSRTTLADRFDGKRLNSPNDIVYHSDGSAYFTDPPYGLPGQDGDPGKELEWNGIYRLLPDGRVELLARQSRPNGIGLSPDERTLYVANSDGQEPVWMAYPVKGDGSLGEGAVFHDASSSSDAGVPDGLAVDSLGNVWATGPGGVWVLSPDGEHLGTVKPAENPANAGFGDDGKTLYMTARTGLYRVRVLVGGKGFGP